MKRTKFVVLLTAGCLWVCAKGSDSTKTETDRLQAVVSAAEVFVAALNESNEERMSSSAALAQAAKEGEAAALVSLRAGISNACERAREMVSWMEKEGYSKDREGYEKLWKVLDAATRYVNEPHNPQSTLAAHRVIKTIGTAAYALSMGLQFMRETSFARNDARAIRDDIKKRFMPYFGSRSLPASAQQEFNAGRIEIETAQAMFAKSLFEESARHYSKARKFLMSAKSRTVVLCDVPIPD